MEVEVEIFDLEFEAIDVLGNEHTCVYHNHHLPSEDKLHIEHFEGKGWRTPKHHITHESIHRLDDILVCCSALHTEDREVAIPIDKVVYLANPRKINFRTGRFVCHQEVIEGSLFKRPTIRNVYQFVTEKKEDK